MADNIRLADPRADLGRVRAAAALAGADEFIEALPQGFETLVGDGGRPLSAGQASRIALARAFLRDAPLVILDEPTAHLDPESADRIAAAIDAHRGRCTMLVISHSSDLAARCDRIVRIEDGQIGHVDGGGGRVRSVLARLLALSGIRVSRVAVSVALGTLTIVFGVGLMATAGYLISRAAERPAVLALTTVIVAVRFFGLARPLARYADRLWSHDLALRALGRVRSRFYVAIEPLAPAGLEDFRRGDLTARMIADVDALQGLYLGGLGPPLVALVAGAICVGTAAAFLPAAGAVLAVGLVAGGVGAPVVAGSDISQDGEAPGDGARRAHRRGRRSLAERARARRLRCRGARPRARPVGRPRARPSGEAGRLRRRPRRRVCRFSSPG